MAPGIWSFSTALAQRHGCQGGSKIFLLGQIIRPTPLVYMLHLWKVPLSMSHFHLPEDFFGTYIEALKKVRKQYGYVGTAE